MPEAVHANEAMLKTLASTALPHANPFVLLPGPPLLHMAQRMRWLRTRSQQGLPEKGLQEQICGRSRCSDAQAASEHCC